MFKVKVYDFGAWVAEPCQGLSQAVDLAHSLTGFHAGIERVCEVYRDAELVYSTLSLAVQGTAL